MIEIVYASGPLPLRTTKKDFLCLADAVSHALRYRKPRTVGVRFVSEDEMRVLNKAHRRVNRPTDVLSFSAETLPSGVARGEDVSLGDIVICPSYADREAARRGIEPREEYGRLFVHGCLHLAGYDHATATEEAEMFSLQERIVSSCDL